MGTKMLVMRIKKGIVTRKFADRWLWWWPNYIIGVRIEMDTETWVRLW